jgi:putative ABC transport system ATP-binding protein
MSIISLQNIEFSYNSQAKKVLDIKSFSINKGEKVFLYGPSGCGKTTFLEVIAGVLVPQSGTFSFLNQDIVKMNSGERDQMRAAHIGYIFQSFNLIPYLSVEENIVLPLYLSSDRRKKVSKKSESEEIRRICEQLGNWI